MIWIILSIIAVVTLLILVSPFSSTGKKTAKQATLITTFMAGGFAISLGLYGLLGTPTPPQAEIPEETAMGQPDIKAMVNGLTERLMEEPEDAEGWAQLIRSRLVLGQSGKLIEEHKRMVEHYEDRPEVIEMINEQSGLNDFIIEEGPE